MTRFMLGLTNNGLELQTVKPNWNESLELSDTIARPSASRVPLSKHVPRIIPLSCELSVSFYVP